MVTDDQVINDVTLAAISFLQESVGAVEFQLRYSDDEQPTIWMAAGHIKVQVVGRYGRKIWECAAAMTPHAAVIRLCEQLVDGGTCVKCWRPCSFTEDFDDAMLLDTLTCRRAYDPELKKIRRGCEGS